MAYWVWYEIMYKSSAPDIPETNYTIQISSKYSVSVKCTTVDWDVTALEDDKKTL